MAIRTYKVTLDSKNTIAPEPVYLRQGDKTGAVVIDATLMDNGSPVSLSGLTPMFKANTADGQAVIADSTGFNVLDSANGELTYQVPNALSSVPGKIATAYFSFSDSSGSESTFDVVFVIKAAVDITQKQAEDYITIIDGTLHSLRDQMDGLKVDLKTIIDNYNSGNFYTKPETDSKDNVVLSSSKAYTDSSIHGIVSLPETFANLAAIQSKYPNGANGVMVAADNGHKYIWTDGVWKDAGVYQSQGIASNSVDKDKQQAVTMPGVFASAHPIDFDFKKGVASVSSGSFFNKENLATNVAAHTFGINPSAIGWIVFDNVSKQFKLHNAPTADETVVGWIWSSSAFVYGAKFTINGSTPERDALKNGTLATFFSNMPIVVDRDKGVIRFQTGFTVRTQDGVNNVIKLESDGGTQPDELNIADNGSSSSWDWLYFDKNYQRIVFGSKNVVGEGYYAGYSLNRGQSVLLNGMRNVITNNGVNIACLGDSFTEGIGTKKRYFEYWQDLLFADNIQANFTPFGVGSTTVADTGWKPEGSFVKRYVQIPDSTDITAILGGANDFNFGSVLGEVNSTDATTFCGGLNTIIDGLRKKNPLMTIICMTPTKAFYENHNWDEWGNSQGLHLIDYVNAMKAVCQVKSVECVDLYSKSGYNPIDVNVRAAMSSDGLHPNEKGHEKLARCSYSTIRNQVITYD